MAGKGRGRFVPADIKKDDKTLAGPKSLSSMSTESGMDDYLKKLDMYRKPVAKDGSCLFRVVSEQIYNTQSKHLQVRYACIDYMRNHKELFESFIEGSYEHHLFILKNPKEWGGQVEISALSHLYQTEFVIFQAVNQPPQAVTCNGFKKKIHLCYLNGNHYDAVYPSKFKSNAAFAQSILYDLLLGNVFSEIERREKMNDETCVEENSSGWTEVKTKQSKGKSLDENSDRIVNVLPEAAKNQKIYWQLKRSLDMNFYRNVELEVWEECKTDQARYDQTYAATIQFKPGDLCLATIKESEHVSETIRVKIHEINADKCLVFSENLKNKYFVHVDDLQPLLNGDSFDSYKNLPGYYHKNDSERDTDFQPQKRRGKSSRKVRDEEERQRKSDNSGSNRVSEPNKRHELRNDKDARNVRRTGRKDAEKKKDIESSKDSKQVSNKSKVDAKKTEKTDYIEKNKTVVANDADTPAKVAKPGESSAAYWGRMVRKTPGSAPIKTLASPIFPGSPSINVTPTDSHIPTSTKSHTSTKKIRENQVHLRKANHHLVSNTPSDEQTLTPNGVILPPSTIATTTSVSISSTPVANITFPDVVSESEANVTSTDCTSITASLTYKDTTFLSPASLNQETQRLFNLSTQASAKVNEVRESIIASSAKIASETRSHNVNMENVNNDAPHEDDSSKSLQNVSQDYTGNNVIDNADTEESSVSFDEEEVTREEKLVQHEQVELVSDEKLFTAPLPQKLYTAPLPQDVDEINVPAISLEDEEKSLYKLTSTEKLKPVGLLDGEVIDNVERFDTFELSVTDLPSNYNSDRTECAKPTKEKAKKKVSFGSTTEIIETSHHIITQVPSEMTPTLEPGKIILPPDHREKHLTEFPTSVQVQELQQQQQQQRHVIQPTLIHTGMSYYAPPVPTVVPMFYSGGLQDHTHLPVTMSRDPEGKDLPEDINTLRYFFNLGVQWHYMMSQQNNIQINQPGILPIPVQPQQIATVSLRPIVVNPESSVHSADCYSSGSQSSDNSLLDVQQTQNAILQGRMQPQINLAHSHLQTAPFEEYELPPRLRRGPINRGNSRHMQHRQMFNGRGIMGQGPKPRLDYLRGSTSQDINFQSL